MSNFKWGVIAALCALFISVTLSVIAGVPAPHVFARALIFSAVFFGLGFGLRFVINSFLPELLYTDDQLVPPEINEPSGAQVNITLDTIGEYAVPELYKNGDSGELGNIEDLISGAFKPGREEESRQGSGETDGYRSFASTVGIDQNPESGYNDTEINFGASDFGDITFKEGNDFQESAAFEKPNVEKPAFTPSFGNGDSGLGGLPDLDMMASAFSPAFGDDSSLGHGAAASVVPAAPIIPLENEPSAARSTGNKPQAMDRDYDPKLMAEGIRTVLSKSN